MFFEFRKFLQKKNRVDRRENTSFLKLYCFSKPVGLKQSGHLSSHFSVGSPKKKVTINVKRGNVNFGASPLSEPFN